MLRAFLICPDQELSEALQNQLSELNQIAVVRWIDRYPDNVELVRAMRAHSPQILFLGLTDREAALLTASRTEAAVPGTQVITFGRNADSQSLMALMREGIREYLCAPFPKDDIVQCLRRVKDALDKNPIRTFESQYVFAFLPAKPGVGTSTTALNAAYACSRLPENRSLLIDMDLNSGMQRFMLKLDNEYSIVDAAENAFKLDETLWPQLVTPFGKLDVLHSGRLNPGYRIEGSQVRHILEFARRNYQTVCADLSGNMEKYSIELMLESRKVFLVTTPEIASLHLARERFHYLRSLDLSDRIQLILNRSQKRAPIPVEKIEDLLGLPVLVALPNDYQGVARALTAGKPVDANSELGKEFAKLATEMMERQPGKEAAKGSKKTNYLGLLSPRSLLAD
jgi:pilus assembly protein CpaE